MLRSIIVVVLLLALKESTSAQTEPSTTATAAPTAPANAPVSATITASGAFRMGMLALEKQQFRAATDAFRTATELDPANTTFLHFLAKALLYADFNNRDSVRLAFEYINLYSALGKETSALQVQKAQVLRTDIENRLESLIQDSLKAAQKQALRTNYDYSYKATAAKPPPPKVIDSSLAGASDWRCTVSIAAGILKQSNNLFDEWASGGVALRAGAWLRLTQDLDWGFDAALSLRVGGVLDQASLPAENDSTFLKRLYEVNIPLRLRFNTRSGTTFGAIAALHLENVQRFRTEDARAWQPIAPFYLIGAGLFTEPRTGETGLVAEGRLYFFSFGGTAALSRMITGSVGYAFGSADLCAEGAYAERSGAAETSLYARLALHWHFFQTLTQPKTEGQQ